MMQQHRVIVVLTLSALMLLWAEGAHAQQQQGFYFGLGGGIGMMDIGSMGSFDAAATARFGSPDNSSLEDDTDVWGLQVGYRFHPFLAAELGYVNLGRGSYEANYAPSLRYSVRFLSSGPTLAVLGMFPLTKRFDVHGRAGLFLSDTRVRDRFEDRNTGAFQSVEPKGRDPDLMLGVGATWNINASYSMRMELTRFLDVGKESQIPEQFDVDSLQLSVLFR